MSLTTAAKTTKLAFVGIVVFILVYFMGAFFLAPAAKNAWKAMFPPKNPPNPAFGLLEPIQFEPQKILNTESPKYTLFTSDGKLPANLPQRMKVYKYIKTPFSYEAGKRAARNAETLGFSEDNLTTNLKGDVYTWVEPLTGANLTIDTNTQELNLRTPQTSLTGKYPEGSMDRTSAKAIAKNVLQNIGRFSDPLYLRGSQEVNLGSVENGVIEYTSYAGEAEIGMVEFFREIEDFPIVGPNHGRGLVRVYVGKKEVDRDAVGNVLIHPHIEYNVREIQTQTRATYPVIPVGTAWNQVIQDNAVISYVKPNTQSPFQEYKPVEIAEILVNDISLAYYDDSEEQLYLQPVYVFEGNYIGPNNEKGSISLYYPAVSGEYVKQVESEPLE
ncbi:hypothetical protein GF360_02170 [candidate division WWE3 bacterium]|nr:hypothetical protein [candidate division WWE3 bacterium]